MSLFRFIIVSLAVSWLSAMLPASAAITSSDMDKALRDLDRELAIRDTYLSSRQKYIDSLLVQLRRVGSAAQASPALMLRLGEAYTAFNNDSALHFLGRGVDIAGQLRQDSLATVLKLRYATLLPLAGFFNTAISKFNEVDTTSMSPSLLKLYYSSGRQMYSYIASFFSNYPEEYERYNRLSNQFQSRLVSMPDDGSALYRLNQGEYYYLHQEFNKAENILSQLIGALKDDDNLYARASHMLSGIARSRGDHNARIFYLARSAIADIRSATLEVTSLQELGTLLFESDEVSRANEYLSAALSNAVACHASLRVIETSEAMPLIASAHAREIDNNRRLLLGIMMVLVVLLIGLILLLYFLRREMRQMHALEERLRGANKVKEVYISQFLKLCSIYMDKLNSFCKIAHRKISTGKVDDLFKMTQSGKFIEEQSREFYDVFDDAFLHIYPMFLEDVNRLLRDDGKIELKEGERMNADLRILAFMRLGIEESARIAQVLNYSVYTIYTYRNKLKNRAINRETFDRDVMNIDSLA